MTENETADTVNDTAEQNTVADTEQDTASLADYAKNIFNPDSRILDGEETPEQEDTDAPEQVEEATEAEDEPTEDVPPAKTVLELNVDGNKREIDYSTDEGKKELVELAQKGSAWESKRQAQNEKERSLNQFAQTLAYQTLYLQSKGELNGEDFLEKPYEFFVGKGETEKDDLKLWNDHKKEVDQKKTHLNKFTENHNKTSQQFNGLVEKFAQNHPEVTDVPKWIAENIMPYHDPVFTYGNVPYPEDTIENIYFAKNKDKIIKDAVDKALKDYVKKPVVKKPVSPQVRTPETSSQDMLREHIQNVFNPEKRKLAG